MSKMEIMQGNAALAYGARLSRVQVIPVYPITPQTSIVEELARFVADGQLDAKVVHVESEHSACTMLWGAEMAGARCFTATSAMGLGYMFEPLTFFHGNRLPVVMGIASRTLGAPMGMGPDYSDIMSLRDFGFIQLYVESNQEALDSVIQAYKIAEDKKVLLPVLINVDGWSLSFAYELVSIPEQEQVDRFLPPFDGGFAPLRSEEPSAVFQHVLYVPHMEKQNEEAMRASLKVIEDVDEEFGRLFGRKYGVVEGYRTEGAEVIFVTLGSLTGTAREVVDALRAEGKPVGLLKLRVFRPFPAEHIKKIAGHAKVLAVIDRNLSHGAGGGSGVVYNEVKSAFYDSEERPIVLSFMAGVGGIDITEKDLREMATKALEVARAGKSPKGEEWVLPPIPEFPRVVPKNAEERLIYPGTTSCQGCPETLAFRTLVEEVGDKNLFLSMTPCCLTVTMFTNWPNFSTVKIPYLADMVFAAGASGAAGVRAGLDAQGKTDNLVVAFAGDGGTADIGLQSLSAAANRGEPILYVCLDNEAYMNTGIQRSGTTPFGSDTTTTPIGGVLTQGSRLSPKDMMRIMAAHDIPYAASVSLAYMADFRRKIRKAVEVVKQRKGLAYIHVQCPCPPGWKFPSSKTINVARLAVQTGAWDLCEVEYGKWKLTKRVSGPKPVPEYLKLQGRFHHLSQEQTDTIQKAVDKKGAFYAKLASVEESTATLSQG